MRQDQLRDAAYRDRADPQGLAEVTASASSSFAFDTRAVSAGGVSTATRATVEAVADLALQAWSQYLGGVTGARLEVEIRFDDTDGLASARAGTLILDGSEDLNGNGRFDEGDRVIAVPGTLIELRDGRDPNGAEPDILITISEERLVDGEFFISTDLTRPVPRGQFDLFSVLLHEIGHGFGFTSLADEDGLFPMREFGPRGGRFEAEIVTGLDRFTREEADGALFFEGENAVAVFGAPIPLEFTTGERGSDRSHFLAGPVAGDGPSDLRAALLNPFIFRGERSEIGALEIALLEDVGHIIQARPDVLLNAFDAISASTLPFVFAADASSSPAGDSVQFSLALDRASPFSQTSGSVAYELAGLNGDAVTGRATFAPDDQSVSITEDADGLGPLVFARLFGPLQLRLDDQDASLLIDTQTGQVFADPFGVRVIEQAGDQRVSGGAEEDLLVGGGGDDQLLGGAGDDLLFGDDADPAVIFAFAATLG